MDNLTHYKKDVNSIFTICINILNVARSFDDLAFEMELLAINGTVHSEKIDHRYGNPLSALTESLSDIPKQIAPEIAELETLSTALFRKIVLCSLAVRRFYQYTRCFERCLHQSSEEKITVEFDSSSKKSDNQENLDKLKKSKHLSDLQKINIQHLMEKNTQNMEALADLLQDSLYFLHGTMRRLEKIQTIGLTAKYLGTCISINASYLSQGAAQFHGLVHGINEMVSRLENMQNTLLDHIQQGNRKVKILMK